MNRYVSYLLLIFVLQSFSQKNLDSVNLIFSSDYEKKIFTKSLSEKSINSSFLNILFSIDSTYTLVDSKRDSLEIDKFLISLKSRVFKYNEKKKVKFLFDKIHERFFNKYELDSYFSDIFQTATYNCVTGTALYSYVFDYFKIPYQIKETPTHVFLVAYPKKHNIYVETTLPGINGSYSPSEGVIKKAVNELVEMKIITQEHVSKVGYSKAFNDYYYGDENITKKDIIGIQYYNKAVVEFNKANYEKAYNNILKSKLFYQNEKTKLFSEGLLTLAVNEIDFKIIDNFKWFLALAEIKNETDFLNYKLLSILSEDTWGDKEHNYIEKKLKLVIENEELKNELLQTLYGVRAERYSKLQQYKNTLLYAEKIYQLNPNNLTAKNYITESKIISLANKNLTEERLKDLEQLVANYPFITDFGVFIRYKIYLYAFLTHKNFSNNKLQSGLKFLKELEFLMDSQLDGVNFSQEAVGNAYGDVGAYYYRMHEKGKAIEYLNRGLKYSPDNENINRKLNLIEKSN